MTKKSIKGFLKSRHFIERQKERKVSDSEIKRTLTEGTLRETDVGHYFFLGSLKVTVDLSNETLITVHPGDPSRFTKKILTKEEAKEIRNLIDAKKISAKEPELDDESEFLRYVKESSVKKI